MFNKIFVSISTTILALFCLVSGAVAATVTPPVVQALSMGDTYVYTVEGQNSNFTDHTFTFTSDFDGAGKFWISTTNDDGEAGIGVANLLLTWTTGSGNSYAYTDGTGVSDNSLSPFFETLTNGVASVLTISGDFLNEGSSYTLTVLATPLPPAVIAFGTAMLGVGFLARRRRKKKEVFA